MLEIVSSSRTKLYLVGEVVLKKRKITRKAFSKRAFTWVDRRGVCNTWCHIWDCTHR